MQSDSTGVWYLECKRAQLSKFLLKLQADSVIYPDECEYLISEEGRLDETTARNSRGINPLCHQAVTIIPHDDRIEIIVNRLHEKLDQVTQLPLRVTLLRQLRIWGGQRRDSPTAVCILELDNFSNINDTTGHATGDLILFEIARRLEQFDMFEYKLVRLHGDEFALALIDYESTNDIHRATDWVHQQFSHPFNTATGEVYLTPSIGIAETHSGDLAPIDLLERAYIALNHAKDDPLSKNTFFCEEMAASLTEAVQIESQLNSALKSGDQLEVWYQPKVPINTNDVIGLEALVRWRHPEGYLVPPVKFIPIAEKTSLICTVTDVVLHQVAKDLPNLRNAGFKGRVSINISAKDFLREHLVSDFITALAEYDIAPSDIELEITESAFISDFEHCKKVLIALKSAGFALSIDDFGTGYSSLSYLTKLPVDTIKVDMSFVRELTKSTKALALFKAIVDICNAMGFNVLAEGVDSVKQRAILSDIGCHIIQGYLISKPLDKDTLINFIEQ